MAQALQKQSNSEIETVRQLYRQQWELAFAEVMDIMAAQYNMELSQGDPPQPTPLLMLWRESLEGLSPAQMREGLKGYMKSDSRSFKPLPEDIVKNAPNEATDKPRAKVDPDCQFCDGTGWKQVPVSSITHDGETTLRSTRCECRKVVFAGKEYSAVPQLPTRPEEARRILVGLMQELPPESRKIQQIPTRQSMAVENSDEKLAEQKAKLLREAGQK